MWETFSRKFVLFLLIPKVLCSRDGLNLFDDRVSCDKTVENPLTMHQNSIKIILLPESTSFDEARASVASALTFNRHDAVARPSTKKNKAPNPPTAVANAEGTAAAPEKEIAETDEKSDSCNSSSAIEAPATAVTVTKRQEEGESTPTMPPSALRNANKPSGGEKPARVVQFSPDTKTTSTQPTATPVPYNKWIANAGVFESSFTGQPVKVAPTAAAAAAPTATVSRRPVKSAVSVAAAASSVSSVAAPSMSPVTPG